MPIEKRSKELPANKVTQSMTTRIGKLCNINFRKNDLLHGLLQQIKDLFISVVATGQDEGNQLFACIDTIFEEWNSAAASILTRKVLPAWHSQEYLQHIFNAA